MAWVVIGSWGATTSWIGWAETSILATIRRSSIKFIWAGGWWEEMCERMRSFRRGTHGYKPEG
jgi:hypothetical protein